MLDDIYKANLFRLLKDKLEFHIQSLPKGGS